MKDASAQASIDKTSSTGADNAAAQIPSITTPPAGAGLEAMLGLPLEIQLKILYLCVTTHLPFIDYGFPRRRVFRMKKNERYGQDDACLTIMHYSRTYYFCALKWLWEDNTFLYSGKYSGRLSSSIYGNRLRVSLDTPTRWSLDFERVTKQRGFENLRHMVIRHDTSRYQQHTMESVLRAIYYVELYPNLKSMCLQLVPRGVIEDVRDRVGGKTWFEEVRDLVHEVINGDAYWKEHNNNYSTQLPSPRGQLEKFTLEGIPYDEVSLLCILCASATVKPDGKLGVVFWDTDRLSERPDDDGKQGYLRGYSEGQQGIWAIEKQKKDLEEWLYDTCEDTLDATIFDRNALVLAFPRLLDWISKVTT